MTAEEEMEFLRGRITEVYSRRENLKVGMGKGIVPPRKGFEDLEILDKELSELDSRFKALWDAQQDKLQDL